MAASEFDDDQTRSFTNLAAGTIVSHYRIISKIGAGGMGEVYLAEDIQLNRRVALKFLPAHLCQDEDCRKRFKREAQAAAKLDHPNIVPVYEVGEFQGRPFFAMAHIEGKSLREVIKEGKLSINEAIGFTRQICEGLHKAHEAGVIHRDIKPGNIIIDSDQKARIVDFGLAMVAGEDKLTKTGSTLGTVGYMSPEQVEGKTCDHRSDLFSVGVILYEMLTGRRPFEGDNDAAIARAITDSTPEPVARYKSGTTGRLQQIIDKALSKDPGLRYQHADGMITDLRRLNIGQPLPKQRRSILWVAPMAAVLFVAIGYFIIGESGTGIAGEDSGWSDSIAVLPFHDLSPGKDQAYWCEGMADAIIGRLSAIKVLKVPALSSVLRFGENPDLKKVAAELKVDKILTGTIIVDNGQLRVRTRLIEANDESQLWTDSYDRKIDNIFAVQDDISKAITEVLEIKLSGEEAAQLTRAGTDNIEAYSLYLRGRYFWNKRSYEHTQTAIDYFNRAIALDPNYAQAYSGLADAWMMDVEFGVSDPDEEARAIEIARAAINKALELDSRSAEAYASLGFITVVRTYNDKNKLGEAAAVLEKSIELNPGYAPAHLWYSIILSRQGRQEEREKELFKAYELSPVSPSVLFRLGEYYDFIGNIDKAIETFNQVIRIEPSFPWSYNELATIYRDKKQYDKALEMIDKYAEFTPPSYYDPPREKAWIMYYSGRIDEADTLFRRAIELGPRQVYAYMDYGLYLRKIKDFSRAKENYEKALELEPDNADLQDAYGTLIGAYMNMVDEGIEHLEKAIELNPSIYQSYCSLIRIQYGRVSVDSTIALCESVLKIRPKHFNVMLLYQLLLMDKREYRKADSVINELAHLPDSINRAWGRESLADPLIYQGRIHEAIQKLHEGIENDLVEVGVSAPPKRKYSRAGNLCSRLLGNYDEAIADYRKALAYDSILNDPKPLSLGRMSLLGLLAESMEGQGFSDSADMIMNECYQSISSKNRAKQSMYYALMAGVMDARGDYDSAAVLLRLRYETSGKNFIRTYNLGKSLLEDGKVTEAIETLEESARLYDLNRSYNPEQSVLVHYYLARAYEAGGRNDEAVKQYGIFLDYWGNGDEGLESVKDAKKRLARLKETI
jgi:serine/threonine protein kinase/tetratricopeptide (TPR) repeat protein